jgi:hypothetical protein
MTGSFTASFAVMALLPMSAAVVCRRLAVKPGADARRAGA